MSGYQALKCITIYPMAFVVKLYHLRTKGKTFQMSQKIEITVLKRNKANSASVLKHFAHSKR